MVTWTILEACCFYELMDGQWEIWGVDQHTNHMDLRRRYHFGLVHSALPGVHGGNWRIIVLRLASYQIASING